jgi:hypothetical protein
LVESYPSGLVVCRPQPLQYAGDEPEKSATDGMEYERFSKDRREAKRSGTTPSQLAAATEESRRR